MLRTLRIALLLTVSSLLLTPGLAHAQDLGGELGKVGEAYADGYVQPMTNAFGSDLNAGLFRTADVGSGFLPLLPVDVYVGVSASAALLTAADRQFTFEGETIQQSGQTINISASSNKVPTAFGSTSPSGRLVFDYENTPVSEEQSIPPGLVESTVAPFFVPQIGLGSVAGTDVQIRYLPKMSIFDFGVVGVNGLAVRHDLDQWIPVPLPLNIAAQGAWNQVVIEDGGGSEVMNASGWAFNLQASKGVPVLPVVVYGGLQYESFGVDYNYTFEGPLGGTSEFQLSQDAATSQRLIAGVSFTLAVVRVNVDYAVTNHNNVATAGIGVRL